MKIGWENISHLLCPYCGKDHCDAANQADGVSPQRFAETSGCESRKVYEVAQRIADYVNDLADLQEEGWKRAQALLAESRRRSPDFQKFKAWWSDDKNWFCILTDDGINQTTLSLTVEEASLLSMTAEPPVEKIPSAEMRAQRIARDTKYVSCRICRGNKVVEPIGEGCEGCNGSGEIECSVSSQNQSKGE